MGSIRRTATLQQEHLGSVFPLLVPQVCPILLATGDVEIEHSETCAWQNFGFGPGKMSRWSRLPFRLMFLRQKTRTVRQEPHSQSFLDRPEPLTSLQLNVLQQDKNDRFVNRRCKLQIVQACSHQSKNTSSVDSTDVPKRLCGATSTNSTGASLVVFLCPEIHSSGRTKEIFSAPSLLINSVFERQVCRVDVVLSELTRKQEGTKETTCDFSLNTG